MVQLSPLRLQSPPCVYRCLDRKKPPAGLPLSHRPELFISVITPPYKFFCCPVEISSACHTISESMEPHARDKPLHGTPVVYTYTTSMFFFPCVWWSNVANWLFVKQNEPTFNTHFISIYILWFSQQYISVEICQRKKRETHVTKTPTIKSYTSS